MRSLRKILISSLILIVVGIIGLFVTLLIGNIGTGISNFGAGRGYNFRQEDIGHMNRGFYRSSDNLNLNFEDIGELTHEYLERNNLSGLEVAEIMEFSRNFYIEVYETDTGIGALELLVDKSSGAIFPEYGPSMMWNLKYGMHSQIPPSQDDINMDIDEDEALELAERYLSKTNSGEIAGDEVEKFYGYYTIHTLDQEGSIAGMLSVNGFTGDVWYHNWHGLFIDMTEGH